MNYIKEHFDGVFGTLLGIISGTSYAASVDYMHDIAVPVTVGIFVAIGGTITSYFVRRFLKKKFP